MEREHNEVAVLLPCRNEEGAIQQVIQDIQSIAPDYKIYVCDNNSDDKTASVAKQAGAVVISEPNSGKGYAMTALFKIAHADCYIMCDGDNTYDLRSIRRMADTIFNGYDMVSGNRFADKYCSEGIPKFHRISDRIINHITKRLYGSGVDDILSGYRAMSDNFVQALPDFRGGFTLETELSIFALKNHCKLTNMPVRVKKRTYGKSKIKITDGLRIFFLLITAKNKIGD